LEDRGICETAGSACASKHPAISGVLQARGTPRDYLDSTLRISLSEFTTKEEIDYTLETLYNCIPMLRKYTRR
ncbi:cysteine desulfurase NifS, partial [[Ruminococcus] torques]|nr:cysteine desulfurase NifS [[Ruminococcus] torques]